MSGNGGNPHSLRDLLGTYEKSGLGHRTKELGYARHFRLLKELDVVFPQFSEQKRIVAILDEAFAGIDAAISNTEKNLVNTRELFESCLNAVFIEKRGVWSEVKVEDACSSIIDCINKTAPTVDGPTPFKMIRTTNVRNGFVNLSSVKYVTEEIFDRWTSRQIPKPGDVILTREAPLARISHEGIKESG